MVELWQDFGLFGEFYSPDGLPRPIGDDDDGIPDDDDDYDDDGIYELMGDAIDGHDEVISTVVDDLDGITWYHRATMSLIHQAYPQNPPTQDYVAEIEAFEDSFVELLQYVQVGEEELYINVDDVENYKETRKEYSKCFTEIGQNPLTPCLPFSAVLPDYPILALHLRDC